MNLEDVGCREKPSSDEEPSNATCSLELQQVDYPCELATEPTQLLQSSSDEAHNANTYRANLEHQTDPEADVHINSRTRAAWTQTDHKETDDKDVQVDSSHLEFNEPSLQKDDKKVTFYTGLPNYATLSLVIELVTSGIEPNRGVLSAYVWC